MKIVGVAIKMVTGFIYQLPVPNRHHHIFAELKANDFPRELTFGCTQGFITDDGTFVDRKEALEIARESGQVKDLIGSVLTSEDLW